MCFRFGKVSFQRADMVRSVFVIIAAIALSSCNTMSSSSQPQTSGGQGPQGGPNWALPPGQAPNKGVAAINPDISIPTRGIAGSWSGGRLAAQLTPDIRSKMIDLTQASLTQGDDGQRVKWSQGSLSGTIVPQMAFTGPGNALCREFQQTLRYGGKVETGYATACQSRTGQWQLLDE